jgi:hypothetical protein
MKFFDPYFSSICSAGALFQQQLHCRGSSLARVMYKDIALFTNAKDCGMTMAIPNAIEKESKAVLRK